MPQQRGLAAAVGANDAVDATASEVRADTVQYALLADGIAEIIYLNAHCAHPLT
jgi:hypothetical protein